MTRGRAGITSTLYVQRVPSEAMAQNFNALAAHIKATPVNTIGSGCTPAIAPSTAIATKTPGYARRITANTGSLASMAPLARSTRSLDIDSQSSASIITSTATSTRRATIPVPAGPKGPALQFLTSRQRHVTRELDQIFDWHRPPRRDERGQSDGAGRPDHHAQCSIETPLDLELASALRRKLVVCRLARR